MRKAKLTKEDIIEMLNLYFNKGASQVEIAKQLGTNQVTVTGVIGYYRSTKGGDKNCPKAYKAFIDEIKKDRLEKVATNAKKTVDSARHIASAQMGKTLLDAWKEVSYQMPKEKMLKTFLVSDEVGQFNFDTMKGKVPHKCPICNGRGFVPGGFYGSTTGNWSTTSATPETCRSCLNGIIWG